MSKEEIEKAHNRFKRGTETTEDLLEHYKHYRMDVETKKGSTKLDLIELKYYEKLVNIVKKQDKIINEMALAISSYDIDEEICKNLIVSPCNGNPLKVTADVCAKCLRQYFEKKVEEKI